MDPSVGKIYVKFENTTGSTIALSKLSGWKYDGWILKANYYAEEKFENEIFD